MITISDKASIRIIKLIEEEGFKIGEKYLRVGVKGSGCAGLSYDLGFDDKMNDGDQLFEDKGVKIVCDKKSFLYLFGTELDFSDGLNGKGFEFKNPNASRTCSCGESFAVWQDLKEKISPFGFDTANKLATFQIPTERYFIKPGISK